MADENIPLEPISDTTVSENTTTEETPSNLDNIETTTEENKNPESEVKSDSPSENKIEEPTSDTPKNDEQTPTETPKNEDNTKQEEPEVKTQENSTLEQNSDTSIKLTVPSSVDKANYPYLNSDYAYLKPATIPAYAQVNPETPATTSSTKLAYVPSESTQVDTSKQEYSYLNSIPTTSYTKVQDNNTNKGDEVSDVVR